MDVPGVSWGREVVLGTTRSARGGPATSGTLTGAVVASGSACQRLVASIASVVPTPARCRASDFDGNAAAGRYGAAGDSGLGSAGTQSGASPPLGAASGLLF